MTVRVLNPGRGGGSVNKLLALQASGPEVDALEIIGKKK